MERPNKKKQEKKKKKRVTASAVQVRCMCLACEHRMLKLPQRYTHAVLTYARVCKSDSEVFLYGKILLIVNSQSWKESAIRLALVTNSIENDL